MARIGVFICHCGENISRTVDCVKVAETAARWPGVVHSVDYKYMCSDPGQNMIRDAIKEHNLNGVVIAACSPKMHEPTFRKAAEMEGLNPYLVECSNIREHVSWVHEKNDDTTEKAIELTRLMVEKVKFNSPLEPIKVPVTKRAMVVGGGVTGIQTALDIADGGIEVLLVEKDSSIGGKMAGLSETFPTLDCSQCILTPKMVDVANHPNIKLMTYTEVDKVEGYIGNFKITLKQKAKYVDQESCNGCGDCWNKCPAKKISSEFEQDLGKRTAIYMPFPQAIPAKPVIDNENCIYLKSGKCGLCEKVCLKKSIRFEDQDEYIEVDVGSVVLATGFECIDWGKLYPEYGGGDDPDIIDGLQFERLASASGPTAGAITRPSDGKVPETVVFIKCVGSRDPSKGLDYCSKICCMYTAKHALLYKHKVHHGEAIVFYMDIRSNGKMYDEFVRRTIEEDGVKYQRGRVSRIYRLGEKLIVQGMDTITSQPMDVEADMVVLATAMTATPGATDLAQKLSVGYDNYGFISEIHPKLKPIETSAAGVFIAGACQFPKDIPESVTTGSAAAAKVLAMFSSDELTREPTIAEVNEVTCIGCFSCERVCPYGAIERKDITDRAGNLIRQVASVNEGLCQGCGPCNAICPSNSIEVLGFTDEQIYAEITSL